MKSLLFLSILWIVVACGSADSPDVSYAPQPDPPGDKFAEVQPLVVKYCQPCHDGQKPIPTFPTGAAFKASKAKTRIGNASMPPNGPLPADVKTALLNYLN